MTEDLHRDASPVVESDDPLELVQETSEFDREFPCARLIGVAGSGKTYTLQQRVAADKRYGLLTSTTGISAVNLGAGCTTLHATLGYFDTDSMRDAYMRGQLTRKLHAIATEYRWLIVEEYSMLVAEQLDILFRATQEANRYNDVHRPLGILLVGDLAQLPPVKGRWCFEADSWPRFAASTERLDKVWRQDQGPFLDALNAMRRGEGANAVELLTRAGVRFETQTDNEFDGTTIFSKNAMVNRHNGLVLSRLAGKRITVTSRRWGRQRPEWGENARTHEWGIPPQVDFKIGALVMCLTNAPDFSVVNGDTGHIIEYAPGTEYDAEHFVVRMLRTGRDENIYRIVRGTEQCDRPDGWDGRKVPRSEDFGTWLPEPHYRAMVRRYVLGQVEYFPLRLAWASTVHRSQGLTLDAVQVDYRDSFFSSPGMAYVAFSRCRTLGGMRMVGMPHKLSENIRMDKRILPWI